MSNKKRQDILTDTQNLITLFKVEVEAFEKDMQDEIKAFCHSMDERYLEMETTLDKIVENFYKIHSIDSLDKAKETLAESAPDSTC